MNKKNKPCDHSHIRQELYKDGLVEIQELKCYNCGKTWRYNTLLNYWSDSFLGVFKKNG
jgi:hypothetical protein